MSNQDNRYMTRGVQEKIPAELQLFMWNCIDELKTKGEKLDYLQVFNLTNDRVDDLFFQKIEHSQEIPKYNKVFRIFADEIIDAKIFVIDDKTHSTMLLAEEY